MGTFGNGHRQRALSHLERARDVAATEPHIGEGAASQGVRARTERDEVFDVGVDTGRDQRVPVVRRPCSGHAERAKAVGRSTCEHQGSFGLVGEQMVRAAGDALHRRTELLTFDFEAVREPRRNLAGHVVAEVGLGGCVEHERHRGCRAGKPGRCNRVLEGIRRRARLASGQQDQGRCQVQRRSVAVAHAGGHTSHGLVGERQPSHDRRRQREVVEADDRPPGVVVVEFFDRGGQVVQRVDAANRHDGEHVESGDAAADGLVDGPGQCFHPSQRFQLADRIATQRNRLEPDVVGPPLVSGVHQGIDSIEERVDLRDDR